jgi:hypothetical protein
MTETAPPQTNGATRRRSAPDPSPTTGPKTDTARGTERFAAPPKLRRKPMLVASAVITITLGALLAAYLTTVVGHTKPVVAVRNDVARGETISQADLMVVQITPDPALKTVPGDQLISLVGKHASVDLPAGGLVTSTSTTDATIPAVGQSLVGVSLTPAQLPGEPLRPGMKVRIVNTPRQQDDPPAKQPAAVPATVVTTHTFGDQGQVVVDVTVPQNAAAALAAAVATGRVALVVDGAI